jgi:hypothetical protein
MEHLTVYVLTCLTIDGKGNVFSRNVGVTFDVFVAEAHKGDGVENDFETFPVSSDWREDAEQSKLISTMREFREIVRQMQEESLRLALESANPNSCRGHSASSDFTFRFISRNSAQSRMLRQRRSSSKDARSACSPGRCFGLELRFAARAGSIRRGYVTQK